MSARRFYTGDRKGHPEITGHAPGFPSVDAGDGWLIFAAPPSELACHPA